MPFSSQRGAFVLRRDIRSDKMVAEKITKTAENITKAASSMFYIVSMPGIVSPPSYYDKEKDGVITYNGFEQFISSMFYGNKSSHYIYKMLVEKNKNFYYFLDYKNYYIKNISETGYAENTFHIIRSMFILYYALMSRSYIRTDILFQSKNVFSNSLINRIIVSNLTNSKDFESFINAIIDRKNIRFLIRSHPYNPHDFYKSEKIFFIRYEDIKKSSYDGIFLSRDMIDLTLNTANLKDINAAMYNHFSAEIKSLVKKNERIYEEYNISKQTIYDSFKKYFSFKPVLEYYKQIGIDKIYVSREYKFSFYRHKNKDRVVLELFVLYFVCSQDNLDEEHANYFDTLIITGVNYNDKLKKAILVVNNKIKDKKLDAYNFDKQKSGIYIKEFDEISKKMILF